MNDAIRSLFDEDKGYRGLNSQRCKAEEYVEHKRREEEERQAVIRLQRVAKEQALAGALQSRKEQARWSEP